MSDIEELGQRISVAMERVSAGLEGLSAVDPAEVDALRAALAEEKTVTAQLEDRVKTLKERQAAELAQAQEMMQEAREKAETLDVELQRLRQANTQLREQSAALRDANAAGVGDADLINSGMQAELEGLQAQRAADVAEASAILAALTPLLAEQKEASDA